MKRQLNFLFIILFIIILAYLLAPDREYRDRLRVLKGIAVAAPYRAAVNEYWRKKQALPDSGDLELEKIRVQVDLEKTAADSIAVGNDGPGSVTVYFSKGNLESVPAEPDNIRIILIPHPAPDKLLWSCTATMPDPMIPELCKKM